MLNVTYATRLQHTINSAEERLGENKSAVKTYKASKTATKAADNLAALLSGYWGLDYVTVEALRLSNDRYFLAVDMEDIMNRAQTGGYVFAHLDGHWTITPASHIRG